MLFALALSGLAHFVFLSVNNESVSEHGVDQFKSLEIQLSLHSPEINSDVEEFQHPSVSQQSVPSGAADKAEVVDSVQVRDLVNNTPSPKLEKSHPPGNGDREESHQLQKKQHVEQLPESRPEKQLASSVRNSQQKTDSLRLHLYRAISENKQYPYRARRQNKQGTVKLSFVMHPDGLVSDVTVIESSYNKILDVAAQRAINSISPFAMASQYLNYKHQYNVDIEFRLN